MQSSGVGRHDFWEMWSRTAPAWRASSMHRGTEVTGQRRRPVRGRRLHPVASPKSDRDGPSRERTTRRNYGGAGPARDRISAGAPVSKGGTAVQSRRRVSHASRFAVPDRSETHHVHPRNQAFGDAKMVAAHATLPDQGQSSSPAGAGGCTHPETSSRARWKARPSATARTTGAARPASRLRTKTAPIAAKECNSR